MISLICNTVRLPGPWYMDLGKGRSLIYLSSPGPPCSSFDAIASMFDMNTKAISSYFQLVDESSMIAKKETLFYRL